MIDAIALVEQLRAELDALKVSDPTLDPVMLDRLHAAVSADIYLDEMFGPSLDEPRPDLSELLEEASTMNREVQAFMAAGVRAYLRLEAGLPAA